MFIDYIDPFFIVTFLSDMYIHFVQYFHVVCDVMFIFSFKGSRPIKLNVEPGL